MRLKATKPYIAFARAVVGAQRLVDRMRNRLDGVMVETTPDGYRVKTKRTGNEVRTLQMARVKRYIMEARSEELRGRTFVILRERPFDTGDAVAEIIEGKEVPLLRRLPHDLLLPIEERHSTELARLNRCFPPKPEWILPPKPY